MWKRWTRSVKSVSFNLANLEITGNCMGRLRSTTPNRSLVLFAATIASLWLLLGKPAWWEGLVLTLLKQLNSDTIFRFEYGLEKVTKTLLLVRNGWFCGTPSRYTSAGNSFSLFWQPPQDIHVPLSISPLKDEYPSFLPDQDPTYALYPYFSESPNRSLGNKGCFRLRRVGKWLSEDNNVVSLASGGVAHSYVATTG